MRISYYILIFFLSTYSFAQLDTDGDWVLDDVDDCPNTYGQIEYNGCACYSYDEKVKRIAELKNQLEEMDLSPLYELISAEIKLFKEDNVNIIVGWTPFGTDFSFGPEDCPYYINENSQSNSLFLNKFYYQPEFVNGLSKIDKNIFPAFREFQNYKEVGIFHLDSIYRNYFKPPYYLYLGKLIISLPETLINGKEVYYFSRKNKKKKLNLKSFINIGFVFNNIYSKKQWMITMEIINGKSVYFVYDGKEWETHYTYPYL